MVYITMLRCFSIWFFGVLTMLFAFGETNTYAENADVYQTVYTIHQREKQFQDTHFCWYHGMARAMYIDLLANTYLDHFINGTPLSHAFLKLRCDHDFDTREASLSLCMQNLAMKNVLFVNLSFPGCCNPPLASTLYYFMCNYRYIPIRDDIINSYIQDRNVQKQVHTILEDIVEKVSMYPYGVVLQVCIPYYMIPQCVFISQPGGAPSGIYFRAGQDMQHLTSTFCSDYIYNHDAIYRVWNEDTLNTIACIWLHSTWFARPHPDIYIYAYHTFPQSLCDELYDRLKEVVCQSA